MKAVPNWVIIVLAMVLGLMIANTAEAFERTQFRAASVEITKNCMLRIFYEDNLDVRTTNVTWIESIRTVPMKSGMLKVEVDFVAASTFQSPVAVMPAVDVQRLVERFSRCSGLELK